MRRLLLYSILLLSAFSVFADLGENGYYRVRNASTKRFAYLMDNKGWFDVATSSADVQALELYRDPEKVLSDPASIFYVSHVDTQSSKISYDIAGQRTSVHGFLDEYVKIMKDKKIDGMQSYLIYASKSGLTKYLGDRRSDISVEKGLSSVDVSGDRRLWYFLPVDASSEDSYFGVSPTLTAAGKHYYPLYAAFPFKAYSQGMKFYIVTRIDSRGAVVIKEVDGVIPDSTPVIVECSDLTPSGNRLDIGGKPSASTGGNLLKGVCFDNDDVIHYNRTPFDKKSMRVLTVKNGKLVFGQGNYDFVPRNQAYLQLTDVSQYNTADFAVLTEEEYKKEFSAVEAIPESVPVDVYGLDGRLIKSGIYKEDVSSLGKGLYIIRYGEFSEKLTVR